MFKKEIIILYYALRDKRTGILARVLVMVSIIYLLNPFDLVPDFIPFFGFIDDFLLVSLGLNLAIRLLPPAVLEDSILKASKQQKKFLIFVLLLFFLMISFLAGIFLLTRHIINR